MNIFDFEELELCQLYSVKKDIDRAIEKKIKQIKLEIKEGISIKGYHLTHVKVDMDNINILELDYNPNQREELEMTGGILSNNMSWVDIFKFEYKPPENDLYFDDSIYVVIPDTKIISIYLYYPNVPYPNDGIIKGLCTFGIFDMLVTIDGIKPIGLIPYEFSKGFDDIIVWPYKTWNINQKGLYILTQTI